MRIVHFHSVHGSAVVLSEDNLIANRTQHFSNGIAFSALPIRLNQKVCLELTHSTEWSGALRIGVTSVDPGTLIARELPPYVCPDLTNKDGYWARAITENYADSGNRITFYVNSVGQLHYFVNNEHKGMLLNHLPTDCPLWVMLDIYGNTTALKVVPADEAPVEILARGPDAMQAYHKACEMGTQPVFRTRLMLVGQDRVGKTSLKKSLTGQRHNASEQSTEGIDLSASCSFNLRDRKAWKVALNPDTWDHLEDNASLNTANSGTLDSLEEEYHRALATNIVQELLYRVRERERLVEDRSPSKQASYGSPQSSGKSISIQDGGSKSSHSEDAASLMDELRSTDLLQEMPDEVVNMVEELMKERDARVTSAATSVHSPGSTNGRSIMLNIWDFAGQAAYYTTHQVFLSSRAVYVIVFNMCLDLFDQSKTPVRQTSPREFEYETSEMCNLDYMDYWMSSIHAHTAHNTRDTIHNNTLSPPIFIVGTHRNSLHHDPQVRETMVHEKFDVIKKFVIGKPYERHIVPCYYAVENNVNAGEDDQVIELRRHIEEVASRETYMGEQMPIKWLRMEQSITQLREEGTYFSTIDQMWEVAKVAGITQESEFKTLLEFYHDLGVTVYYGGSGTLDTTLRNTIILKPQWLIDIFKRIITFKDMEQQWGSYRELWHRLDTLGILEEKLIDHVWQEVIDQKSALLGLMDKFDLICERLPPKNVTIRTVEKFGRSYFVPSRMRKCPDTKKLYSPTDQDVAFYLDFNHFLPDGLFHRILTRAIRWSQECGGHEPHLFFRKAKFFLDSEHDYILEMLPVHLARVKVAVLRVVDLDESEESSDDSNDDRPMPPPKPSACAKVRNFLESTLSDLRELWMKRISYSAVVECYCDRVCASHNVSTCHYPNCQHFLNLDECLSNKIVCCEHRRVKTATFRKWFPAPTPLVKTGPILPDSVVKENVDNLLGNIEAFKGPELPTWVKSAAKLLNGGSEGQDWTALGKKLGYKKNKTEKFNDDLNPALALITDWIISSGNTSLSVDMMISCLEQMARDDIIEIIQKGQEAEVDPPQVFISYQWDSQDEVSVLRDKLEKAGFTCWMDIGQMGGGDQLYTRIDEGIRNAKLIVACVTPKYIVSHHCSREISLADLLRKPILPVMYDKVPWPPPGGMALMFSQLVYINMKGVGGHGGSGIHADLESKYQEIIQRVSLYATATPQETVQLSPRLEVTKRNDNLSDHSLPSYTFASQSPAVDSLVIPGYGGGDPSGPLRQATFMSIGSGGLGGGSMGAGRGSGMGTSSSMVPEPGGGLRNTAASPSGSQQRGQVEQVHVTKCAVCTIL